MSDVKWIKIVTDIFDDEKILLIESMPDADAVIVIWFKLLCLAGKQNNSGVFTLGGHIPYTDEMFATIFRRPVNTVRMALKTFEQFGMVEVINNTVTIPNWGKHQSIEQIEARKEYMRNYQREYYAKQKALASGNSKRLEKHLDECLDKCLDKQNLNTPDKNREDKNRLDKNRENKAASRFTPPTVDEVSVYCKERNNGIDAESFVDYYTSKGWRIGNGPMKDWKAAVRTWERRDAKPGKQQSKTVHAAQYEQRTYTEADFDKLLDDPILRALESEGA